MKNKKGTIVILSVTCLLIGIILLYTSHALFTAPSIEKSAITIKAGTMDPTIKVDGVLTNQLTIPAGTEKVFTVTLENLNAATGRFLFYYIGELPYYESSGYYYVDIRYLDGTGIDTPPGENGVILPSNGKQTYSIYVENTWGTEQTITLGSLGGLESYPLTMPEDTHIIPSLCFYFNSSTATITGYGYSSACSMDVIIPDVINGIEVKTIGEKAFENRNLNSVIISDSVTNIESHAFAENKLTSVIIPNSVKTIGWAAFSNNQLTDVVIPDSVTIIDGFVFYHNQLTSVTISDTVTDIGYNAFSYNELTNVTIPDNVTTIEAYAFSGNQLTSVTIPDNVTTIESGAFSSNQLTSVTIPDSVTSLGNRVFSDNELTSVTIGKGLTSIPEGTFENNQLTSIVIPDNVITIGQRAFWSNQLANLTVPDSVTTIGRAAFSYNELASVTIGTGVTTIESSAFSKKNDANKDLTAIVNKTGRSFDWKRITDGSSAATFVTGTIPHANGDITVTSE